VLFINTKDIVFVGRGEWCTRIHIDGVRVFFDEIDVDSNPRRLETTHALAGNDPVKGTFDIDTCQCPGKPYATGDFVERFVFVERQKRFSEIVFTARTDWFA
jgi:hypothetical protein